MELLEQRPQAAHDLDPAGPVLADLVSRQRQVVLPAARRDHHAATGTAVLPGLHRQLGGADQAQRLSQVVEHLHRRRRVVDGGRQREVGNVDEDPDRERRILLDRALVTERHHVGEAQLGAPPGV